MKIERSVWFGETGTETAVIFFLTVFFFVVRFVVVVFLTMIVTWTSPHRSAVAASPVNDFLTVTTFVFGVAFCEVAAAQALTPGSARAAALSAAAVALRMVDLLSLSR